jgi:hypothetical protein
VTNHLIVCTSVVARRHRDQNKASKENLGADQSRIPVHRSVMQEPVSQRQTTTTRNHLTHTQGLSIGRSSALQAPSGSCRQWRDVRGPSRGVWDRAPDETLIAIIWMGASLVWLRSLGVPHNCLTPNTNYRACIGVCTSIILSCRVTFGYIVVRGAIE